METPARHSFTLDGSTRVFPIPSNIKGDNYVRLEVDDVIINDRAKYDIVNNSIVFNDVEDVPEGSQLDVLVVQSEEAIGALGTTTNMDIVAANITNVNTVGNNITDVNSVADNMAEVLTADTNAATATAQATIATTQAGIATTQATTATTQAGIATTKASEASTSASNASASATTATTQAGIATTKASEASTSASNASASASSASTSATTATTQASNASASATSANTSATNAATSASSASTSASNAATAATNAETAFDNFDDRYLGAKASDPTLDNDGDALITGALYFNTTDDVMKVYEGSVWIAAYASLSGALIATNNLSDVNDVSVARTNLGLIIGTDVQPYDDNTVITDSPQTLTNKTVEKLVLNDGYTEEVFAISDGASVTLDPNNGSIQTWTLGASRTPTQANWAAGQSIVLQVDDGTAYTIDWTTIAPVWKTDGGTAPTLETTGVTVIVLWKVGTTIYGARVGDA